MLGWVKDSKTEKVQSFRQVLENAPSVVPLGEGLFQFECFNCNRKEVSPHPETLVHLKEVNIRALGQFVSTGVFVCWKARCVENVMSFIAIEGGKL